MRIGIAGPVSLRLLEDYVEDGRRMPDAYAFPLIAHLVVDLHRRGHHVEVFALDPSTKSPATFRGERLDVHVVPQRGRPRNRALDAFKEERLGLARAMASSGIQVAHAHWTYEFAWAAQATGRPLVVTAHDSPLRVAAGNRHPYWWVRAAMAARVLTRTHRLTVVAPHLLTDIREHFRYTGLGRVIPNGVSDSLLVKQPAAAPLASAPVFATVLQNWSRRKNPQDALRAFAIFRKSKPQATLRLFGRDFGPGEAAATWARSHGLASGCEFRGSVSHRELLEQLSEMTALLHTSLEEACSMAILEALALGVPVVGGLNSGGVAWTLGEGAAGELVSNIRDPADIAAAMMRITEPSRRGAASLAGRELVRRQFTQDLMTDAYCEEYESALRGARGH
jgi:glycosyltransferase involved in cell wall biosynthesis